MVLGKAPNSGFTASSSMAEAGPLARPASSLGRRRRLERGDQLPFPPKSSPPPPTFQDGPAINTSGPRMLIPTTPAPPCLFPVHSSWGRSPSPAAGGWPGRLQAQKHTHTHTHFPPWSGKKQITLFGCLGAAKSKPPPAPQTRAPPLPPLSPQLRELLQGWGKWEGWEVRHTVVRNRALGSPGFHSSPTPR